MNMRDTLQASLKTQLSNSPCKRWTWDAAGILKNSAFKLPLQDLRMRDTLQASLKTQLSNCPCKIWKWMNMRDTLHASLNTQLSNCPCKIWQLGKKKISQRNPVAKTENDSRDPSATLPSATFTAMRSVMVLLAETNSFLNFRNLWGPLYKKHSLNCPYPFTSPRQNSMPDHV